MSYSICTIDDVTTFDPYTILSRMETVDNWFENFWASRFSTSIGEKIAERPADTIPVSLWNKVALDEAQNALANTLVKAVIILLGIARDKGVRRAVIMFHFERRFSNDGSMENIHIRSAIFKGA